jgi:simple sugar transport system permease protein
MKQTEILMKQMLVKIGVPVLSILLAFVLNAILITAIGGNAVQAYHYLLLGAFANFTNFGETLVKVCPLIFTGLAAAFAYRCGVFNLGGEGQFLMGSTAAIWCATLIGGRQGAAGSVPADTFGIICCLAAGAIAGGIWGAIPGILKIARGLNEMIVSIMLNYIASFFMSWVYTGPLRAGNVPQTDAVAARLKLARLFPGTRIHSGIIIALAVTAIIYYFLFYTAAGFKLRAIGLNQTAARFNGLHVKTYILAAFIVSGAIAGLGGSIELQGTQYRLMDGYGGYGFDGVAIALIGQLNPIGTVIVAYLFAALRTGATMMQVGTGIPTAIINIIQALVIIFAVAGSAAVNLPAVKQFLFQSCSKKEAC